MKSFEETPRSDKAVEGDFEGGNRGVQMTGQQRELALKARSEMQRVDAPWTHEASELWALEYARRLFAAWQGSQEPVAWANQHGLDEIKKGFGSTAIQHKYGQWNIPLYAAPVASADALDAKRIDYLESLRSYSIDKGYQWNAWKFSAKESDKTIREQIDAAMQEKRHD